MIELLHFREIQVYKVILTRCKVQCKTRLYAVIISEVYRIVCNEMYSYTCCKVICYSDIIVVVQRILVNGLILLLDVFSESCHLIHLVRVLESPTGRVYVFRTVSKFSIEIYCLYSVAYFIVRRIVFCLIKGISIILIVIPIVFPSAVRVHIIFKVVTQTKTKYIGVCTAHV